MLACCNGKHFPKATLTVRKAGENPLEYLLVTVLAVLHHPAGVGVPGDGGVEVGTEALLDGPRVLRVAFGRGRLHGGGLVEGGLLRGGRDAAVARQREERVGG